MADGPPRFTKKGQPPKEAGSAHSGPSRFTGGLPRDPHTAPDTDAWGAPDEMKGMDDDPRPFRFPPKGQSFDEAGDGRSSALQATAVEASSSPKFPAATGGQTTRSSIAGLAVLRRARALVWLLGIAAVLAVGASSGWWLRELRTEDPVVEQITTVVDRPVIVQQPASRGNGRMPDVVGLSTEQAERVLVDAGLLPEQIEVVEQESALESGEILGQDPSPGAEASGVVTLWRSIPAVMPDLVALSIEDARDRLQSLGARVTVTRAYVPGLDADQVVRSTPNSGQPMGRSVELTVSAPGTSIFLAELRADESAGCSIDDFSIGASSFDRGIYCDPDRDAVTYLDYITGPSVVELSGALGRPLSSDIGVPVSVRILVDGRVVRRLAVVDSSVQEISVDISGGSRVRIEAERTSAREEPGDVFVGFGDFRFTGSAEAIQIVLEENR